MSFNVLDSNNFEYQGHMFPETPGAYDYLVRFSTNGGQTLSLIHI